MFWVLIAVVALASLIVVYKVGYQSAMRDAETIYQQKLTELYAKLLMHAKERTGL